MEKRLLFQLSKIHGTVTRYLREQIQERGLDLSFGQMGILFLLKKGREMAMGDISAILDMDNGAVTRLIDRLWEKNLVKRNPSPLDRRRWLVSLTPEGLQKANEARDLTIAVNRKIRSAISEEEEDMLLRITDKLYRSFSE